jgi:hypothetical protein
VAPSEQRTVHLQNIRSKQREQQPLHPQTLTELHAKHNSGSPTTRAI